jgi:hypothetical protein
MTIVAGRDERGPTSSEGEAVGLAQEVPGLVVVWKSRAKKKAQAESLRLIYLYIVA